jgi:hypothetical protein
MLTHAKQEALEIIQELERRRERNALQGYEPYPKQQIFHNASKYHRERMLEAGNQLGKTLAGSMEVAMHLTGEYPDWYKGRTFDGPTRWWAASETGDLTRDAAQRYLLGEPKDRERWGTGAIPHRCLGRITMKRGVPDAVESCLVKHKTGGWSSVQFKSYDQGRERWQGETLHGVWFDEEPPKDVYEFVSLQMADKQAAKEQQA